MVDLHLFLEKIKAAYELVTQFGFLNGGQEEEVMEQVSST